MPTTDAAAMSRARSLASAEPILAGHVETIERDRPQLHAVAAYIEPDPWTTNRYGTDHDQTIPLADNECPHGHLATDERITCDCYEVARIRRHAAAAADLEQPEPDDAADELDDEPYDDDAPIPFALTPLGRLAQIRAAAAATDAD